MAVGRDSLSTLPDEILVLILSRISTKCAIKCSVLSKRWRYVYTQIPELRFSPALFGHGVNLDQLKMARLESIISNLLLLHSSDLEGFHLEDFNDLYSFNLEDSDNDRAIECEFTADSLFKWLRYLGWKNVQRLTLCRPYTYLIPYTNDPRWRILPSTLFSCTRLTKLVLDGYNFPINIPTHFPGFNHLTTGDFSFVDLSDDYLACLISHCPLLQNLAIIACNGLQKSDISALNLTHLKFSAGIGKLEVLTLNCPKLVALNVSFSVVHDLRVNGILFHEFSSMVTDLKLQCGNDLTELWLDCISESRNLLAKRFLEMIWPFKSLTKLSIDIPELFKRETEEMSVPFFMLLENLPHLEFLEMRGRFLRELAADEIPLCLSFPLAKLGIIQVHIDDSGSMEINERQIAMLDCLLQSTPSLEIMEFQLLSHFCEHAIFISDITFKGSFKAGEDIREKIFRLRGASKQVRIFEKRHFV